MAVANVSVADVKGYIRLPHDRHDAEIGEMIDVATAALQDAADTFSAPQAVADLAVKRMVAHLYSHRGDEDARPPKASVMRLSGASAILAPWRKHHGAVLEPE